MNKDCPKTENCTTPLPVKKEPIWKTLLVGFLVGIGAIAPGISGGAIAVVFGLYSQITDAISHFYRDFKNKMRFLIPFGVGAVLGVALFSRVVDYFFTHFNVQTRCLFIGLIIGTLPSVFKTANKEGFRKRYLLPMAVMFALTLALLLLEGQSGGEAAGVAVGNPSFPLMMAYGAVLGFGTIVPGVSSSFLLMSMGAYEQVLGAISSWDPLRILPLVIGFGACVLLIAKLVDWLYRRAYGWMSYIVLGLLLGSIVPVVPPLGWDKVSLLSVALAIVGGWVSWGLLRLKKEE